MSEMTGTGFVWHELMTPHTAGAQEFYREVTGLTATPGPILPSGGPEAHWVPYILLPSVRGDLLAKLGRLDEARAEFECAATLTDNVREREILTQRVRSLAPSQDGPPYACHARDG